MIRETMLYRVLSSIHIVFFTSLLCFGTICLSGTVLLMPAITAAFIIGKDVIYRNLDVNDSIIKTWFKYLKPSLKLTKYFVINIIIALNAIGMMATAKAGNFVYSVACLSIIAFLFCFVLYIAGHYTFVNNQPALVEVFVSMFIKLQLLIPVFIIMVFCVSFFSVTFLVLLFLSGTIILFAMEVPIFIQMMHFKKTTGKMDDQDEFAYLVN